MRLDYIASSPGKSFDLDMSEVTRLLAAVQDGRAWLHQEIKTQ